MMQDRVPDCSDCEDRPGCSGPVLRSSKDFGRGRLDVTGYDDGGSVVCRRDECARCQIDLMKKRKGERMNARAWTFLVHATTQVAEMFIEKRINTEKRTKHSAIPPIGRTNADTTGRHPASPVRIDPPCLIPGHFPIPVSWPYPRARSVKIWQKTASVGRWPTLSES